MGREELVKVFEDTRRLYEEQDELVEATRQSVQKQKLVLEGKPLPHINKRIYSQPAEVVVSKKRSFEAAAAYKDKQVCVHNFASSKNPGGGVERGASAQEECLCRISNLYPCLSDERMMEGFYLPHRAMHNQLYNDDIIYTPGVVVFKSDTDEPVVLPEKEWYKVNVVTCAAPNLRPGGTFNMNNGKRGSKISDEELMKIHEKRLRRILDVALIEKNEVVILGAFGCGAFQNNPEVVARAAQNVIAEYLYSFKTIELAVYCNPRDEKNYTVFAKELRERKL